MNDQPNAESSTWQHITFTSDRHTSGGIQTRILSKREISDSRFPCGFRDILLGYVFPHHAQSESPRWVISPSQRLLPTKQTQETNSHALSGIRTRDHSSQAPADVRLRPRGHGDRKWACVRDVHAVSQVGHSNTVHWLSVKVTHFSFGNGHVNGLLLCSLGISRWPPRIRASHQILYHVFVLDLMNLVITQVSLLRYDVQILTPTSCSQTPSVRGIWK